MQRYVLVRDLLLLCCSSCPCLYVSGSSCDGPMESWVGLGAFSYDTSQALCACVGCDVRCPPVITSERHSTAAFFYFKPFRPCALFEGGELESRHS